MFNLAGVPVAQIPLGLNERGLPLGVQAAAGPGRDHAAVAVALELERALGGWVPPPYMSDPVVHQVLFYDYVEDVMERRGPYRAAHLDHAQAWKDAGKLVSGGALGRPPSGGMLVFLVDDPSEVEAFAAEDPYVRNGIVTGHRVVPWTVVV